VSERTVRERIADIHDAQLRGGQTGIQAAEWLNTLGALTGNVLQEIREAEADYTAVYAKWLDTEQKANRAKIRAEMTPQYQRLREARDTFKLVDTMIGTLKYLLRAHEADAKATR
jgi:hypothetical protein